ncbi:MAG TPA: methyl-accepting chemotaxis protein [Quisquiliibacterium sp.]|nr:methyl-accepting chemotaxis protein [Quisquiliibacterium sp.]HQN11019.1 methyl-accepting chemotaxis protein [Quisquiliibacterium sp.]
MTSLKQLFGTAIAVFLLCASLLAVALVNMGRADDQVTQAQETRYRSYLLADELRQSSDDLTRLARTYVVTGDAMWEKQYLEVLDIRNGRAPRPAEYEKIYWDFRAAGQEPPRGKDAAVPLQQLMKDAGFTEAEFAKLKEAQANSDDLVRTETVAMNMVKGQYDDGAGGFTRKDEPDMARARTLLHDKDYHQFKARIMKPVDEFLSLVDRRTHDAVVAAEASRRAWFMGVLGAAALVCAAAILALWYTRRWILVRVQAALRVARAVADGDLTVKAPVTARDEIGQMLAALDSMGDSLTRVVGRVRQNADSVATASAQIAQGNQDLSQRTEMQASALQETAASMEELGATTRQNADSARQASALALEASTVAGRGGDVVGQVVETMRGINDSSKKIADIINVIDGIAFQTNILALNAAVEAARAGEQGRGFAVVASEVRSLAQRSADAAKEIKALITASVERVEHGTVLVDQAGDTMQEIVASIRRVADIVGEISSASEEQTTGVVQAGEAISAMDRNTQQNAALVEESAAAADSLRQQAQQLVEAMSVFRIAHEASLGPASGFAAAPTGTSPTAAAGASASPSATRSTSPNAPGSPNVPMSPSTSASTSKPASTPKASTASAASPQPRPGIETTAPAAASTERTRASAATAPSEPAATAAWDGAERRGPDRARNVVRPAFGASGGDAASGGAPKAAAQPARRTGTDDDDWDEF